MITSILSILVVFIFIARVIYIFDLSIFPAQIKYFNTNIVDNFVKVLRNRDSTLITLSAVFIGIYFTTFTLLATISSRSTFSLLDKFQFKSLINYIKNAFLASFLYLIVSLTLPLLNLTNWYISIVIFLLLVYMLLSAFRFGYLIYIILVKELDRIISDISHDREEMLKRERLYSDLEKFLEQQHKEYKIKEADKMSEFLSKKKQE